MKLMNRSIISVALLGTLAAAACSPTADAIAPISVAGQYDHLSCAQTQQLLNQTQAKLNSESQAQNTAAAMDAVGVFLVLVPVSKVTGNDHQGTIAMEKGQVEALNARLLSCYQG